MHNITLNDTVREALAIALMELMKEKHLFHISVSDIVKKAGVCRSSFYRNYTSKEEILIDYIQSKYKNYFQSLLNGTKTVDMQTFLYHRLRFIKQHKEYYIALNNNNLLFYLFDAMDPDLANFLSDNRIFSNPYHKAMFVCSSAGIIKEWIERDFKESEKELMKLLMHTSIITKAGN